MPRKRSRRFKFGILLLLGLIGLGILYFFRQPLFSGLLKDLIRNQAAQHLGLTLEIEELEGTFLNSLTLKGLSTLRASSDQEIQRIEAKTVRLEYSIWAAVMGSDMPVTMVQAEGLNLVIDLQKRRLEPRRKKPDNLLPSSWPRLDVQGSFTLLDKNLRLEIPSFSAIGETNPHGEGLSLIAKKIDLSISDQRFEELSLESEWHYKNGVFQAKSLKIPNRLEAKAFALDLSKVGRPWVGIDADLKAAEGEVAIKFDIGRKEGKITANARRLKLSAFTKLLALEPPPVDGWFDFSAQGEGPLKELLDWDLEANVAFDSLRYEDLFELRGQGLIEMSRGFLRSKNLMIETDKEEVLAFRNLTYRVKNRHRLNHAWEGLSADAHFTGSQSLMRLKDPRLTGTFFEEPGASIKIPDHTITTGISFANGVLELDDLELRAEGLNIRAPKARLVTALEESWLHGTLRINVQPSGMMALFGERVSRPLVDWDFDLSGDVRVDGAVKDLRFDSEWSAPKLRWKGQDLGQVRVDFNYREDRLQFRHGHLTHENHELLASGELNLRTQEWKEAVVRGQGKNMGDVLPGIGNAKDWNLTFEGSGNLHDHQAQLSLEIEALEVANSHWPRLTLDATLEDLRLTINESLLRHEIGGLDWRGSVDYDLSSGQLTGEWSHGHLVVFDHPRPEVSRFPHQEIEQAPWALKLQAPASFTWSPTQPWILEPAVWKSLDSSGTLTLSADESKTMSSTLANLSLPPLVQERCPEAIRFHSIESASVQYQRGEDTPSIEARMSLKDLDLGFGVMKENALSLSYRQGSLVDGTLSLALDEATKLTVSDLRFPWSLEDPTQVQKGDIGGTVQLNVANPQSLGDLIGNLPIEGRDWFVSTRLEGTSEKPQANLSMVLGEVRLAENAGVDIDTKTLFNLQARYKDGLLSIDRCEAKGEWLDIQGDGSWRVPLDLFAMTQGELLDLGQPIQAEITTEKPLDLTPLSGMTSFRRVEGLVEANLNVSGTLEQLDLDGGMKIENASCRLRNEGVPAFENFHAQLSLSGPKIILNEARAEVGGALVTLSGTANNVGFDSTEIDLLIRGKDALLYRDRGVKVRSDLDLEVKGPLSALRIEGTASITDSRFVRNFDFLQWARPQLSRIDRPQGLRLFSLTKAPWNAMTFDVQIEAKELFSISTNLVKGELRPKLTLSGTGQVPTLKGRIFVEPTRVSLPATSIDFEQGVIAFDDPDPFTPHLNILGSTQMRSYDIRVQVTGTTAEPTVLLTSIPPLPDDDLLLLLLTGKPPEQPFDAQAGRGTLGTVAVFIARDVLNDLFGSESTEGGKPSSYSIPDILNRLEIETGRAVSQTGSETIEARLRLASGVLVERDALYVQGEKDEFDGFNLGIKLVFRFQ